MEVKLLRKAIQLITIRLVFPVEATAVVFLTFLLQSPALLSGLSAESPSFGGLPWHSQVWLTAFPCAPGEAQHCPVPALSICSRNCWVLKPSPYWLVSLLQADCVYLLHWYFPNAWHVASVQKLCLTAWIEGHYNLHAFNSLPTISPFWSKWYEQSSLCWCLTSVLAYPINYTRNSAAEITLLPLHIPLNLQTLNENSSGWKEMA